MVATVGRSELASTMANEPLGSTISSRSAVSTARVDVFAIQVTMAANATARITIAVHSNVA